jgi:hypothetical protein
MKEDSVLKSGSQMAVLSSQKKVDGMLKPSPRMAVPSSQKLRARSR